MRVQTYYRVAVWLPLLIPALVAVIVHQFGYRAANEPLGKVVQTLLISGLYGGAPYATLAIWASIWIDRRPEAEIRRRALLAPLYMVGIWIPFAAVLGYLVGTVKAFAGLVALGAVASLVIGYLYVALVLLLRIALNGVIVSPVPAPAPDSPL